MKRSLQNSLALRNKPFPYVYIRWERMVQKEGRWVPHELSEDNKNRRRDTALTCFQSFGKKIFCTKLLQAMKSGFFMITLNVENHRLTLINFRHRRQSPISTPRRFRSVSGGIEKVCCIMSCYRIKQSR